MKTPIEIKPSPCPSQAARRLASKILRPYVAPLSSSPRTDVKTQLAYLVDCGRRCCGRRCPSCGRHCLCVAVIVEPPVVTVLLNGSWMACLQDCRCLAVRMSLHWWKTPTTCRWRAALLACAPRWPNWRFASTAKLKITSPSMPDSLIMRQKTYTETITATSSKWCQTRIPCVYMPVLSHCQSDDKYTVSRKKRPQIFCLHNFNKYRRFRNF